MLSIWENFNHVRACLFSNEGPKAEVSKFIKKDTSALRFFRELFQYYRLLDFLCFILCFFFFKYMFGEFCKAFTETTTKQLLGKY